MSTDEWEDKVEVGLYRQASGKTFVDIRAKNSMGSSSAAIEVKDARALAASILALCDEIDTEEVMKT